MELAGVKRNSMESNREGGGMYKPMRLVSIGPEGWGREVGAG